MPADARRVICGGVFSRDFYENLQDAVKGFILLKEETIGHAVVLLMMVS